MSIEALNWALRLPLDSPTDKAVLIGLANHTGPDGRCWPGIQRLVLYTSLSERAVRLALRRLEAAGHIRTETRQQSSNMYTLMGVGHDMPQGHALPQGGARAAPGGAPDAAEPSENHQKKPSPKETGTPLPADWWPPASEIEQAALRFPTLKGVIDGETHKFVSHAEERGRTFHRPLAAWRRWIANAAVFAARDNQRPFGRGGATRDVAAARAQENERRMQSALGLLAGDQDVVDVA